MKLVVPFRVIGMGFQYSRPLFINKSYVNLKFPFVDLQNAFKLSGQIHSSEYARSVYLSLILTNYIKLSMFSV